MSPVKMFRVRSYEKGLYFRNGEFKRLLDEGAHWFIDPLNKVRVDIVDMRNPWLAHDKLDLIDRSGVLEDLAVVMNLKDYQRALVWIEGRFSTVVCDSICALWTTYKDVKVEIVDARDPRFEHADIAVILRSPGAAELLDEVTIAEEHVGVYFRNGKYVETLPAGRYSFWKRTERYKVSQVNMAELSMDISGQEIMTADKVTLRTNVSVAYRVVNAEKAVRAAEDVKQSLYRDIQLALRAVIGTRDLDSLLADKDALVEQLKNQASTRAETLGLEIISLGIRDVILPGEMKDILNRVTEARKAAEANLIARREETAAMRSQANTAKLLENNPVLMRLRELEVLEKISANSKLSVVLGEKGLADRVVNLL